MALLIDKIDRSISKDNVFLLNLSKTFELFHMCGI